MTLYECIMKILFGFMFMFCCSSGFAQDKREEKLKTIISKQETDWNKNDISAYGNSFSEDAVLINFLGLFWKGKTEIINQFRMINECCIRPTHIKLDILDVKFLSDASALTHLKETLTAKEDYIIPGGVVKKGTVNHKFITAVFIKEKTEWQILSLQVTQVVPLPPR